jgi:hypothetical protein
MEFRSVFIGLTETTGLMSGFRCRWGSDYSVPLTTLDFARASELQLKEIEGRWRAVTAAVGQVLQRA